MPNIDVFAGDAFNMSSLINAMETLPYKPRMLGGMGLFKEKPVYTKDVWVERKTNRLSILETAPYNVVKNIVEVIPRDAVGLRVPHVPQYGTIMAGQVQGIRAFGSETELQTVASVVNDELQKMKDNHEVTTEYHRINTLRGILYDADGTTVLYNYFNLFNFTQPIVNFYAGTTPNFITVCNEIIRKISTNLGGETHGMIIALCGDNYFDKVAAHTSVQEAYDRWKDGEFKRVSHLGEAWYTAAMNGFMYQNILFVNYRGEIGNINFMPTNEALYFPTGVSNFLEEAMAPAEFTETVNTRGRRYYVKQERMKFDVGVELYSQSNVLPICKRPQLVVKSTYYDSSSSSSSA